MYLRTGLRPNKLLAWLAAGALACQAGSTLATTLSDNTDQAASGETVVVDASNWVGASFISDQTYTSATLSATVLASGLSSATLSLYSSDSSGLIPGSWLADLALTSSDSSSASYTLGSLSLTASRSYWLVLHNDSGTSQWSWTTSSDGSGSGFTSIWANSDDAGLSWFTNSTLYPVQVAIKLNADSTSSVPEPAPWQLSLVALPFLLRQRQWRQWRQQG